MSALPLACFSGMEDMDMFLDDLICEPPRSQSILEESWEELAPSEEDAPMHHAKLDATAVALVASRLFESVGASTKAPLATLSDTSGASSTESCSRSSSPLHDEYPTAGPDILCGDRVMMPDEVPLDQALSIDAPLFSNILDAPQLEEAHEEEPEPVVQSCSKQQLHRPCVACRTSRVLCDRGFPCSRCVDKGFTCTVPESVRRGRPTKAMLAEREKAEKRKR